MCVYIHYSSRPKCKTRHSIIWAVDGVVVAPSHQPYLWLRICCFLVRADYDFLDTLTVWAKSACRRDHEPSRHGISAVAAGMHITLHLYCISLNSVAGLPEVVREDHYHCLARPCFPKRGRCFNRSFQQYLLYLSECFIASFCCVSLVVPFWCMCQKCHLKHSPNKCRWSRTLCICTTRSSTTFTPTTCRSRRLVDKAWMPALM